MKHIEIASGARLLCVPGDIHAPGQDEDALRLMTLTVDGVMRDLALRHDEVEVVLTGDTFDSAGFSPHPGVRRKVLRDAGSLSAEKDAMRPWFHTWLSLAASLRVIAGNHEAWQESDLALSGSPWWEVYGDLFDLPGVYAYAEGTRLVYGSLIVCHGHDLRGVLSQHSAASVLREYPGQNTIYGHTHRQQYCTTPTTKRGLPVAHGAWTVGMMCRRDFELSDRNMRRFADRHQQGFALVFLDGDSFKVELCEILELEPGELSVWAAGRLYRVTRAA